MLARSQWPRIAIFAMTVGVSSAFAEQQSPALPNDSLPETLVIDRIPDGIGLKRIDPSDNLLSPAKVELGRSLFFDPLLSLDRTVSCASCHQPDHGFASPDKLAVGIGGQTGDRNAPSVLNRAFGKSFFWDGRAASLEEQALKPIENEKELGNNIEEVLTRLKADPKYVERFRQAFGVTEEPRDTTHDEAVNATNLARALAAFQRVLLIGDSPVDRFQAGHYDALTAEQRKGLWIFESRGGCWKCHSGDNYTDERFHNTGIGFGKKDRDPGRFRITQQPSELASFKTPTLRGVAQTAPYMHDGSLETLRDVVEFYSMGGDPGDPDLDTHITPIGLTDEEVDAVVAFLEALSQTASSTPRD